MEEEPDESILEHGQDESPQETERLKQLKKMIKNKEQLDIETVKDVVHSVINQQRKSGGAVAADAQKVEETLRMLTTQKESSDASSGMTKSGKAVRAEVQMAKKAISEYSKEQASQDYVDSIEKTKVAGYCLAPCLL